MAWLAWLALLAELVELVELALLAELTWLAGLAWLHGGEGRGIKLPAAGGIGLRGAVCRSLKTLSENPIGRA